MISFEETFSPPKKISMIQKGFSVETHLTENLFCII